MLKVIAITALAMLLVYTVDARSKPFVCKIVGFGYALNRDCLKEAACDQLLTLNGTERGNLVLGFCASSDPSDYVVSSTIFCKCSRT